MLAEMVCEANYPEKACSCSRAKAVKLKCGLNVGGTMSRAPAFRGGSRTAASLSTSKKEKWKAKVVELLGLLFLYVCDNY